MARRYNRLKSGKPGVQSAGQYRQHPELVYVSALSSGPATNSFWGFTLDKGMLDGVSVGMPIVSDAGYLLGMVTEAD